MEKLNKSRHFGCPNNPVWSIHDGVRLRHLARPGVPVHVRAHRIREHEVVREVVGAHPFRGPDHRRYLGSVRAHADARPTL